MATIVSFGVEICVDVDTGGDFMWVQKSVVHVMVSDKERWPTVGSICDKMSPIVEVRYV